MKRPRPQLPVRSNISAFRETAAVGQSGAQWLRDADPVIAHRAAVDTLRLIRPGTNGRITGL